MSAPAQTQAQPDADGKPAAPAIPKSLPDEQLNKVVPIPTPEPIQKAAAYFRQSYHAPHSNEALRCMMDAQNWFDRTYTGDLMKNIAALKLQGATRDQIKGLLASALMEDLNHFGIPLKDEDHLQRAENLLRRFEVTNHATQPPSRLWLEDVTPDSVRQSYETLARLKPGQIPACPELQR